MNGRIASPRRTLVFFLHGLALALLPLAPGIAAAGTIGMVADDGTDSVVVFDAESRTALGTIAVGSGIVGDCSITADQQTGFVTDFNNNVWVVDLDATPPALAQPAPIPVTNPAEDTALTPDGRYLLVCDGLTSAPVTVVDVATRAEVSTFSLGSNCSSVDVCDDGSVLVASSNTGRVFRLVLDEETGVLSASGDELSTGWIANRGPNNVHCAPGSASGVLVRRGLPTVLSFQVPGLAPVDSRALTGSGFGLGAAFDEGTAFVRTSGGTVDAFDFDAATGALGAAPRYSFASGPGLAFLGIDQLAMEPTNDELWVPVSGVLEVRDPATGDKLGALTGVALSSPTGVCFPSGEAPADTNLPPDCATALGTLASVWPPQGQLEPVTVGGVVDPDGDPVELLVTGVFQDESHFGQGRQTDCTDAVVTSADSAAVRASRDARADGRVYHIAFTADDGRGGTCEGAVQVCVPVRPGGTCADQGPVVDSLTGECPAPGRRGAR